MFDWFKRLRKKELNYKIETARIYLKNTYEEPSVPIESIAPKRSSSNGSQVPDGVKCCLGFPTSTAEPDKIENDDSHDIKYSAREPGVKYSHGAPIPTVSPDQIDNDNSNKIKYSARGSGVKYSSRDNYNSNSIQAAMRNISVSKSPSITLKELEDNTDMSFVDKMLEHIYRKKLRDSEVYKAAQIDRRLFSKIVSDNAYKPAKDTCIALCLAMKLTLPEANDLLSRAGYTLSHSSKRDVVLEYFFRARVYNIMDVNDILFHLDQKVLGRA